MACPYKGRRCTKSWCGVPLVISWPGRIRAARSDALVSLIDLLPTLCDLAGVPAPSGIDGVSLRPVLEQRAPQVREMVFAEYDGKQSWRVPIRMVRTERWKYVRYVSYGEELYDWPRILASCATWRAEPGAAPETGRALARELDDWIRPHRRSVPTPDGDGSVGTRRRACHGGTRRDRSQLPSPRSRRATLQLLSHLRPLTRVRRILRRDC